MTLAVGNIKFAAHGFSLNISLLCDNSKPVPDETVFEHKVFVEIVFDFEGLP